MPEATQLLHIKSVKQITMTSEKTAMTKTVRNDGVKWHYTGQLVHTHS